MKRLPFICLSTLLLMISSYAVGQNASMNWYFGQTAGITFNSGSPQNIGVSAMSTWEGCSSISDSLGNLLFYTDGVTVWNRLNNTMVNGTGLWGHSSSTQSALIVPVPVSDSLYYIFTTTAPTTQYNQPGRLAYSVVDMSQNFGLGAVVLKNVLLLQGTTTEKLAGVQRGIDCDAWVLTATNAIPKQFYAYQITAAGINTTPVISTIGSGQALGQGTLKFSPDGKWIANVVKYSTQTSLEIFSFDDSTGIVTNLISGPDMLQEYGAEFSPDSKKLYACLFAPYNSSYPPGWSVYQFDLDAGNPAAILASMTFVGAVSGTPGTMQLGPDNRLYIAKYYNNYLGVISSPDLQGIACNYIDAGFALSAMGMYGLPNMVSSYFIPNPTFTYQDTCYLDSTSFEFYGEVDFYYWDFGDYGSGINNYSNIPHPKHVYSAPGVYQVRLVSVHNCDYDTVFASFEIVKPDLDLGPDTTTCDGGMLTLDAGPGHVYQMWEDFTLTQTHFAPDSGLYWCEVMDTNGCVFRDSLLFSYYPSPAPDLGPDTSVCTGDSIIFDGGAFASWLWNDGQATRYVTHSLPGDYWIDVTDINGCHGGDTVTLSLRPLPYIDLPEFDLICLHQTKLISVGPGYDSYLWDDGTTTPVRTVSDTGIIWLKVWTDGCESGDSMRFEGCTQIYIPSAFTPDGNGLNDVFLAKGIEVQAFSIQIFNRVGEMVFRSDDISSGWDGNVRGEPAPPGAYAYYLRSEDKQGEIFTRRGTVQLLR